MLLRYFNNILIHFYPSESAIFTGICRRDAKESKRHLGVSQRQALKMEGKVTEYLELLRTLTY